MNHYDGPAFFRKYRQVSKKVNTSAAASQSTSATSAAPSRASQASRVTSTAAPVRSAAAQPVSVTPTSAGTPFGGGTHGAFHPSPVPAQLSSALTDGGIIRPRDDRNYLEIEACLHKQPATYLLFADPSVDAALPLTDLSQPLSTANTASMAAAPAIQPESVASVSARSAMSAEPVSSAATVTSSATTETVTPQSNVALPTETFTPQSQTPVETPVPIETATSTAATEVFEPHSQAPELPTEVFEPAQPVMATSAAASSAPTEVFEPQSSVAETTSSAAITTADSATDVPEKPSRGLGVSLGAIMTAEHDVQADLSLFKDAPTADDEPDTTSAASESIDQTNPTTLQADVPTQSEVVEPESVAEPDEDLYQPVGMHARPTSVADSAPSSEPVAAVTPSSVAVAPATTTDPSTDEAVSMTAPVTSEPAVITPAEAAGGGTTDEGEPSSAAATDEKTESAQPMTAAELAAYHLPPLNLLKAPVVPNESEMDDWIQEKASALDESLDAFGVNANVVDWTIGPTVTQFQVKLARGVKVSKITNLNDDLKLALAAKDIRIEAPIPGRNTVGIEIPNKTSRPVMLSEVLDSDKFRQSKSPLTVALGVDLFGQPQVTDLRKMPHGLIAGATGSGKSVFINSILVSILYKANPQEVKLLLIDPKAVEMAPYDRIPHLLAPVISEPKAASAALKWVVDEMDNRYDKLAAGGARNIEQFNKLAEAHHEDSLKMPYIVIVIDELADLMMVASSEVQDYIARITQKARAAGIHLLVATQRPSVDVVTGLIKNNIPTRVAFMVASQIDSRTILDTSGAERLLGRGDMLYLGNGQSTPIRLQGTYVDSEIDAITQFVRDQAAPRYEFQPDSLLKHEEATKNEDELMPEVLAYIAEEDTVSTSKLQRKFSVGYNRAANIIDDLEGRHYVSPAKGSKPRDVYFSADDLTKLQANS